MTNDLTDPPKSGEAGKVSEISFCVISIADTKYPLPDGQLRLAWQQRKLQEGRELFRAPKSLKQRTALTPNFSPVERRGGRADRGIKRLEIHG